MPSESTEHSLPLSAGNSIPSDRGTGTVPQVAMANPIVQALLASFDGGLLILDAHGRIVAANLRHLATDPKRLESLALGLQPGEALGCVHALGQPDGCGAAEACKACGALQTILGGQQDRAVREGECLVTAGADGLGALELRLRATPIEIEGRPFTALAVRDVSDEKRRDILEQVFFHDLLNSISGLSSWTQLLLKVPEGRLHSTAERVAAMVRRIDAEIRGERALLLAERNELVPEPQALRPAAFLEALAADLAAHPLARGRELRVEDTAVAEVRADPSLLARVLTNMVINALEATPEGGTVVLGARGSASSCTFFVRSAAPIAEAIRPRIFQRSFTTKAKKGRGLGTYGMKLLGERYLGGHVGFDTDEKRGTEFWLRLPVAG